MAPTKTFLKGYIFKLNKRVHPTLGVPQVVAMRLDDLAQVILKQIVISSWTMMESCHGHSLHMRHVQTAVQILFKGDVAKHTVALGSKTSLPMDRIKAFIHQEFATKKMDIPQPVIGYLGNVIEYLLTEVLEVTGTVALAHKRDKISLADVRTAIVQDKELRCTLCQHMMLLA